MYYNFTIENINKKNNLKENKDRVKRICKISKNIDIINDSVDINKTKKVD